MIFYISIQTYLIVDLELLKTKEYFLLVCHTRWARIRVIKND